MKNRQQCPQCKRRYKPVPGLISIVTKAFICGEYIVLCPLCYDEKIVNMTGQSWEPAGTIASEMLEEAKKQYPDWKSKA